MSRRQGVGQGLLPTPQLLISESADDFELLRQAIEDEIRPRGIFEQMYVDDLCYLIWEIRRLQRCKTNVVNLAFRTALEKLLSQLLTRPGEYSHQRSDEAKALAVGWFTDPKTKEEILQLLARFQLDESAIEAAAMMECSSDIELLDRILASLESRSNKALRYVAEYRGSLVRQLREVTDKIIEEKRVLTLGNASSKTAA